MKLLERRRLERLSRFENAARLRGYRWIAGVDEAGRGPLAGPVVAAACCLAEGVLIEGVDDSKQLSSARRDSLFAVLTQHPSIQYGVGIVDAKTIDAINILKATHRAMCDAIAQIQADYLLVDGRTLPHPTLVGEAIIQGDKRSISIAAASIIAKVIRDRLMRSYHCQWPIYGFDSHKGYGTPQHLDALQQHGPCPIHRRSFAPLKKDIPQC